MAFSKIIPLQEKLVKQDPVKLFLVLNTNKAFIKIQTIIFNSSVLIIFDTMYHRICSVEK
jgi:hypothetical protein